MLRALMTIGVLMLVCGCSTYQRNTKAVADNVTLVPCETPAFIRGDPVYHAEMAIDIAEYVLVKKGFDCRGYRASVSFCEGIYTVALLSGGERSKSKYMVDIDADTSKILGVKVARIGSGAIR